MSEVSLPPSFPVITAAAPAVGQTKHIISPSASNSWRNPGVKRRNRAIAKHDNNWNPTNHTCHIVIRISLGFTLQNVANSMTNNTVGIKNSAAAPAAGFTGASART